MDVIRQLYPHSHLRIVQRAVEQGTQSTRKHIIMLARHLGYPEDTLSNMYEITLPTLLHLRRVWSHFHPETHTASENVHPEFPFCHPADAALHEAFTNPIFAGAAIMSAFVFCPDDKENDRVRLESYMKEINVMKKTQWSSPQVDFSPFFGNFDKPIHPSVQPNPRMAEYVRNSIDEWISRHAPGEVVLKPHLSTKLLPSATRRDLANYVAYMTQDPEVATQASLEWLEASEGIRLPGGCELKQRHYTNGITPRSYFVSGPDTYYASRFTKNLWNSLVDCLEPTHRRHRVNPRRIHIEYMEKALFYDLTSFTSNMDLQRPFLEALASYCAGKEVTICDTRHGLLQVDLGMLIKEYNSTNTFPVYQCPAFPTMLPDTHGVAGFLGVYGNIATCTFLHGAVLLQLSSRVDGCGCAGDDAVIVVPGDFDDELVWVCVRLLGILALEKTFSTEFKDVIYLKRRINMPTRAGINLRTESLFQFPSVLWGMSKRDLSRFREAEYSKRELKKLAISSISAAFASISFLRETYIEEAIAVMRRYYEMINLPFSGNVPQYHNKRGLHSLHNTAFYPAIETCGARDFVAATCRMLYPGWARVPQRSQVFETRLVLSKNAMFTARPSEDVSFLVKMGFLDPVEKGVELVFGEEGLDRVLHEFNRDEKKDPRYSVYKVVREIPEWWRGGFRMIYGEYKEFFTDELADPYGAYDHDLEVFLDSGTSRNLPVLDEGHVSDSDVSLDYQSE